MAVTSNPRSQAAVYFVSNNIVLSKCNVAACGISLISLANAEKTCSAAVYVVDAFYACNC